jgi:hypothetical protein
MDLIPNLSWVRGTALCPRLDIESIGGAPVQFGKREIEIKAVFAGEFGSIVNAFPGGTE